VLTDNKFLIYGGGLFAGVAIAAPLFASEGVFCVDNRLMCAPLAQPMDDEPSGNEPQPLGARIPLTVITSTVSLNVPLYANLVIKI
jgi:hypothetical protein